MELLMMGWSIFPPAELHCSATQTPKKHYNQPNRPKIALTVNSEHTDIC